MTTRTKIIFSMKKNVMILVFLPFATVGLYGQCSFTPSITSPRLGTPYPNKIIFCNTESEVLSTQAYDSYQWYKQKWITHTPNTNPWVAISGATSQTLTINGGEDNLYNFKVEATINDCTTQSETILASGFKYIYPIMKTTLTPGTFQRPTPGTYKVCNGASVKFENTLPNMYAQHTWYKCTPSSLPPVAGDPCIIPGVTGSSYIAEESGNYSFYACTAYCPDQCSYVGSSIQLNFGDWNFCDSLAVSETKSLKKDQISIYPNPASQHIFIRKDGSTSFESIMIMDSSGKQVLQRRNHSPDQPINISSLTTGLYTVIAKSFNGSISTLQLIKK